MKDEGKFHPTTVYEGPEAVLRYNFTLSVASALDGGGWSTSRPGRITRRKESQYYFIGGWVVSLFLPLRVFR